MTNTNPIGLFDSGIGGTSIWKEIHNLLPNEHTIYLADSRNAPYGEKSKEEILQLCCKNTEFLLDRHCKMIVVACNTATTNAIAELRARYDVPFIGIEPAIKPAAIASQTQTIGILATKGTITSALFCELVGRYPETKIIEQIGHGLVKLIENGKIYSDEMTQLLNQYLQPMLDANVDFLVLGCSHYPYLIPQIKKILPPSITIIDSGHAVAKQTFSVLQNIVGFTSAEQAVSEFYTNAEPEVLENILENKFRVIASDF